jgi:acyl-CoA synthetase (NDP forming)/RimJ/RimL family protein N-acetyltransferase
MAVDIIRDYPPHWEADIVLRDGGTAHLRPITPQDAEALQRMHLAQSQESTFLRFFVPMPRLTETLLRQFTHVDHTRQVALVALIGDEIVGVANYGRVDERQAEVAFNISDVHQGRGLGSSLLEHLAAAARERGIQRFVADVLPQNLKMVAVFREAGFRVTQEFDHGVMALAFDIDPTQESLAVMEAREHASEATSLRALLTPHSIVVIGASRDPESIGARVLQHVIEAGFTGQVHAVNPMATELAGVRCYAHISEVPGPVDTALVVVPAGAVLDVVRSCGQAGVRGLIVMSGGFAEMGGEGLNSQRELVRAARAHGMRLVGPNSMGLLNTNPQVRFNASLAARLPLVGGLGLFSQSGALGVAVLASAARRGLGVSSFVSAGNRADVSGNDCMQYWEEDPGTSVVGLYLESIGNPRKFSRIARRLSRKKPVIVVKSGAGGRRVAPGHAVRSSRAPREALDCMMRQTGVVRVGNIHELFDVAELLLHQPLPAGPRVAIVGNSQATAMLVADAAVNEGLVVDAEPVTVRNEPSIEEFREALEVCYAQDGIDAVVACFIPPVGAISPDMLRALAEVSASSTKTTVACLVGVSGVTGGADVAGLADVAGVADVLGAAADQGSLATDCGSKRLLPAYPTPEDAVLALASAVRYAQWRQRDPGVRVDPGGIDRARARELVERSLSGTEQDASVHLATEEVRALLACYGLTVWPAATVTGVQGAVAAAERLGWPVVLKVSDDQRRHRGRPAGVVLDIENAADLRVRMALMAQRLPEGRAFVIQHMAPEGAACVLTTMEDDLFGPIISFALAGDASELLGDISYRIPPLTDVDVADLIRSVKAAPRLTGYRGSPPLDVAELENIVARLSCLADDLPQLAALELNPVIVAESGVVIAGATAVLSRPAGRTDGARRSLLS